MELLSTITHSSDETERCGAFLAKQISKDTSLPRFVALYGDLGVGKTAFVRGFVSFFDKTIKVKSPTFTLVNEYRTIPLPVFHFDMYRIEGEDDLYSIGFYDYPERGICITEWTEKIEFALPERFISAEIRKNDPSDTESRALTVKLCGGKEKNENSCT